MTGSLAFMVIVIICIYHYIICIFSSILWGILNVSIDIKLSAVLLIVFILFTCNYTELLFALGGGALI